MNTQKLEIVEIMVVLALDGAVTAT